MAKNTLKPIKAGSAKITVKSKNTGKSLTVTVKVKAATTPTVAPTATSGAVTTPSVEPTATTTVTSTPTEVPSGSATTAPTSTPSGSATTAPTEVPSGSAATATPEVPSGSATTAPTVDPGVTAVPTATTTPTQAPEVVSASVVSVSAVNTQNQEVGLNAVTKNGSIKVTFSEVVTESTVNNNTFKITDANGKNISLPVSAVTLNPGGKTVTVDLKDLGLDKGANFTLSISGVKTKNGNEVATNKTTFTVAKIAVISHIKLDGASRDDELDTNMETTAKGGISGTNGTYSAGTIIVKYDEYVDASTATAANITLVNTTTGEQVALTYDTNDGNGKIIMTPKTQLIGNNLYTLTIKGVKTAVNGATEDMVHTFTVNGDAPLTGTHSCRTIDATSISYNGTTDNIWPNTKPGLKSLSIDNSKYYAGLQLLVTVTEALDAQSVTENVMLVEKETKEIVDATITYDEVSRMISIVPNDNLKEETDYQVRFLGGLKTKDNVYLDSSSKTEFYDDYYGFKTMDASEPEVVSFVSKTATTAFEASKSQEFVVTFSETVELDTNNVKIALSSIDLEENATVIGTANYTVTPVAGTDKKQYTIKINENTLETGKAYKIRLVGKDMANYAAVNKNTDVIVDGNVNFLAKSEVYTFSTTADKTAPSLVNVYFGENGTKLDTDAVISEKKTNIKSGDQFTFLFDEELATSYVGTSWSDSFDQSYTNNIKLQVKQQGEWKDVATAGDPANISVVSAAVKNKDEKCVAMTINVIGTTTDSEYRIVFAKGSIVDRVLTNTATGEKPNQMDEFRYEFIGTDSKDAAENVKVYSSTKEKADGLDTTKPIENNTASLETQKDINVKSRFFMVFDELDVTGVTTANVTLKDKDGNAVAGKVEEITDNTAVGNLGAMTSGTKDKATYVFIPEKDLAYNTTYVFTVNDVKDVVGNTVEKKEISFKTEAEETKVSSCTIEDKATNVDMTPVIKFSFNNDVVLDNVLNTTEDNAIDTTSTNYFVALTDANGNYIANAYTFSGDETEEEKDYTISFKNVDATAPTQTLNANTTYKLVVWNYVGGVKKTVKEITFTTGYTATDSVKPELADSGATIGIYTLYADEVTPVYETSTGVSKVEFTFAEKISKDDVVATITNMTDADAAVDVISKSVDSAGTKLTLNTVGMNDGANYKIVLSGVKDKAGNEADKLTYYVSVGAEADANSFVNDKTATQALATGATNVANYFDGDSVAAITRSGALSSNALDATDVSTFNTALTTAINDADLSVTAVAQNATDANKWDITLTSSGYTSSTLTQVVTVEKSKVKFTTANLDADASGITSANTDSVDISGATGDTTEDKIASVIATSLSISNSTVGTTVTAITDVDGTVTGYTITLTDGTATDVSITAVLPVAAVKTA